MRLVRVSEPRMNSCLTGTGGRTPPAITSTTKTYGFDHHHHHHQLDMELFKPTTTTTTKSVGHSSPSSSSSSPSSTISEASDNQQLSLSTKKPRTPRKRPNQTYNEAAALLSTAYPNIFATTNLAKPPFKFSKRVEPNWGYTTNGNINPSIIGEELLLPQSIPSKPIGNSSCNFFEPRLALGSDSNSNNRCTTPDSNPCQNRRIELALEEEEEEVEEEFQFYQRGSEEYDFDAESILDEEIGAGILDSIMGNPPMVENSSSNESQNHHHRQTTTNFCYGIPMGLGLGLPSSSRFDFRLGMTRGIRAFRNVRDGGGGMYGDQWWKCPVTTVEVGAISPRFEEKKAEEEVQGQPVSIAVGSNNSKSNLSDKKKSSGSSSSSKKKKLKLKEVEERERSSAAAKVNERQALPSERGEGSSAAASSGRINLKLNYDEVINAWSDNGSMFSEDAAGSEFTGSDALARLAQIDLFGENGGIREASVQRYKEKRRNRLFTKKIVRYQVRKVNADQRPRVKGRFVRSPDSREDGGEEDKQT